MKILWTSKASGDLARLYEFLKPVAPDAAARVIRGLVNAPDRLLAWPRIGERLDAYAPREVRRIIVGNYEMRYEVRGTEIVVLRVWHTRENRNPTGE